MKYSHLLIPGLLLAFNAQASNPSEEFKDTSKKSWTAQLSINANQETSDPAEHDIDSPRTQLKAQIAEESAMVQMAEQKTKALEKEREEKKLEAVKQQKEREKKEEEEQLQQTLETLKQRKAIEQQRHQQISNENEQLALKIAAHKTDKTPILQKPITTDSDSQKPINSELTLEQILAAFSSKDTAKSSHQQAPSQDEIVRAQQRMLDEFASQKANNNNNQNVPNTNSAIVVSSAKLQYDPGYESSAEFSDFEEDLSYKPAAPRFTATVMEDDNNQNVQPIVQAPVVTSIENDNVTTATNVNHQSGSNVNNEPELRLTGEGISRLFSGHKDNKSNWVNLTRVFRSN